MDSIQYGFYQTQSNKAYIPFEQSEINYEVNLNYNKQDKNNNFCPICHYNYHSHYHRSYCNQGVPVGNGAAILLFFITIYSIYKYLKIR